MKTYKGTIIIIPIQILFLFCSFLIIFFFQDIKIGKWEDHELFEKKREIECKFISILFFIQIHKIIFS